MNFNLKKIASAASSALMIGTTVAMAAAANYPMPFVSGSTADVAIVVGDNASADLTAAAALSADLSTRFAAAGGTSGTRTITGENFPLFTSSSELFMNSTLNAVRTTLTSTELPILLADDTFEGSTSVQYTQKIVLGSNPKIDFAQMPTSDDDAQAGISFSTSPSTTPLYNATVTFDSAVNFTHADSIGEDIMLFGQKFTVGAGTSTTKLVLLKSSETVDLSSDTTPSASITVEGQTYTIELTAATDSGATIKLTDSTGASESKEISESTSKKILGLEVTVDRADENNFRLTATVSVGSNKITLQDGSAVKVGTDDDIIDGTQVEFIGTVYPGNITRIDFQAAAANSDEDAIFPGQSFVDPVFGSFKVDFAGINIPLTDTTDREVIEVKPSGNDKATVKFQAYAATEPKSVTWVFNKTTAEGTTESGGLGGMILADSDGDAIRVVEGALVNRSQYVVIANDADGGGLYEVTAIYNSSSSTASDDYVRLKNVFTDNIVDHKASSEGVITATIEGKTVTIEYNGSSDIAQERLQARFLSTDGGSGNDVILFPTIKTKSGAKVAFYQPTRINLRNFNGLAAGNSQVAGNISSFLFPDGDGYTDVDIGDPGNEGTNWTFTFGSTARTVNTTSNSSGLLTVGRLTYNVTSFALTGVTGVNNTIVYLQNPEGGNIVRPALIVFEEKDDLNNYEAAIFTLDAGYDGGNNDIGLADIVRTYGADAAASLGNEIQLETDSDLYQDMDLWGALFTLDKSDTDQASGTMSYPDTQVEAEVYVAEADASTGGSSGALGDIVYDASEVSTVSNKNLIVLGGSCINTVAAQLLGSSAPLCGADFTSKTQVGTGSFLIQSFASPWNSNKIALLVAGYEAPDTINAANALKSNTVDTTVGKKYTGTTATSLTPLL